MTDLFYLGALITALICIPMLAFDEYRIYTLKQKIKELEKKFTP